jgi:phosphoserine phosphatase
MKIAFDCDDTLIRNGKLRKGVLKKAKYFKDRGDLVYLWSARGQWYCYQILRDFNLKNIFTGVLEKKPDLSIDICYDNMHVSLAKKNKII